MDYNNQNKDNYTNSSNNNDTVSDNTQQDKQVYHDLYTNEARSYYTPYDEPSKKQKNPKKNHFGKTLGKCAAIAVVFGLISGSVFSASSYAVDKLTGRNEIKVGTTQTDPTEEVSALSKGNMSKTSTNTVTTVTDVADIVEEVMPSVVSITNLTSQQYQDFFGQIGTQEYESSGSGIIIGQNEEHLLIVTNNHVIDSASKISVTFIDDTTATAEVKGKDAASDLAVVSIPLSDITPETLAQIKVATVGNSEELRAGESVIAIGNALGYGQSVTTGVVSAVNRDVTVDQITNTLIQTNAAINPGNSGGALLNMSGEVIGINSIKYADTQVEGMGFAIPISSAEPIIDDLITREVVDSSQSAYLGIVGVDVTPQVEETYGMPKGICITQVVEGAAASNAGIAKGDIITHFDGKEITSMQGLQEQLQYYAAGTEVEMTIKSANSGEYVERKIIVTLGRKVTE